MKKRWQSLWVPAVVLLIILIVLSRYSVNYEITQHVTAIEAGAPIDYNTLITSEEGVIITMKHTSVEKTRPGEYQITYELAKDNRVQEKIINISIVDTTGPKIEIVKQELEYGIDFDPLDGEYATASDVTDPAPQLKVTGGQVDTSKAGAYTVSYEASDRYGNTSDLDVVYTVNQKKYTISELVGYARQQIEVLSTEEVPIDGIYDEAENSLEIQFSNIKLYETTENGGKIIVYPYMLLSEEEEYFSFGLAVVPYAEEIFEDTAGLYITSENGRYEAEQIYEDVWSYENSYYYTILIIEVASDKTASLEAVDQLVSAVDSESVSLQLEGSYSVQTDLPEDVRLASTRLAGLFTEIYNMHYGTY